MDNECGWVSGHMVLLLSRVDTCFETQIRRAKRVRLYHIHSSQSQFMTRSYGSQLRTLQANLIENNNFSFGQICIHKSASTGTLPDIE